MKFSKGSNSKLGDADGRKGVKLLLSVALGCTLLCTSCQTPAPQGDVRPVWADRAPGPSEGKSFFVGHSRILDSADEKLGINQATDDALAQIAKATGSELSAGGALAGVRQEATFCEVSSHGGHVKYHVLVSVPEAEMTRLETKLRMGLDSQLAEAQAAIRDGSLTRARDILSSTVSSHPESAAAWTALAETQEKLRDWEGASKAWDSLRRSSNEPSVQDLAAAGLRRANDERAIVRLSQAENAAQAGQSSHALDLLVEAAALKPSPLVLTRLSNRYFELLCSWFGREIEARSTLRGWQTVAVANFAAASDSDGLSVRDRICAALTSRGTGKPKILFVSEEGRQKLQQGRIDALPEADQREMQRSGADALAFGTLADKCAGYTFDLKKREVEPLAAAQAIGAAGTAPAYPTDADAWLRLPAKSSTSQGLRVEVWADKPSFRIGEEIVLSIRANKDCHVTLLDLQTSGGIYVLFPNSFQKENFLAAGRIQSVGGPSAPFSINVSGPAGVEGVKAIATIKPLSLGGSRGDSGTFISARTAGSQGDLSRQILSETKGLAQDDWDIAEWTFKVTQ